MATQHDWPVVPKQPDPDVVVGGMGVEALGFVVVPLLTLAMCTSGALDPKREAKPVACSPVASGASAPPKGRP